MCLLVTVVQLIRLARRPLLDEDLCAARIRQVAMSSVVSILTAVMRSSPSGPAHRSPSACGSAPLRPARPLGASSCPTSPNSTTGQCTLIEACVRGPAACRKGGGLSGFGLHRIPDQRGERTGGVRKLSPDTLIRTSMATPWPATPPPPPHAASGTGFRAVQVVERMLTVAEPRCGDDVRSRVPAIDGGDGKVEWRRNAAFPHRGGVPRPRQQLHSAVIGFRARWG